MNCDLRFFLSVVVGGVLGIGVSWITNSVLLEVSVSNFFSFYFGILLMLIGGLLSLRVQMLSRQDEGRSFTQLYIFSALVVVSGAVSFLLDENLFGLSPVIKVPMYALLGTSISFAFSFSVTDLGGMMCAGSGPSKPLKTNATGAERKRAAEARIGCIGSASQINVILFATSLLGFLFGFVFGVVDVEDYRGAALRRLLWEDELYFCYPVGLLIGGAAGYLNEVLRRAEIMRRAGFVSGRGMPAAGAGAGAGAGAARFGSALPAGAPALAGALNGGAGARGVQVDEEAGADEAEWEGTAFENAVAGGASPSRETGSKPAADGAFADDSEEFRVGESA